MDDDDFIKQVEKHYERWTGESWEPEKALKNFPLYGRAKRIESLEQIDAAVKAADPSPGKLRQYAKLTALQREAETLHQMMVKNGR